MYPTKNGYDCGVYAIKFIDFDSLDASLIFTSEMVRYREILQYSISSLTYKFLGVHEVHVPIVDSTPDQWNYQNTDVHIINIEEIQHDYTKQNPGHTLEEDSLSDFMSVKSKCDMKMMIHKCFEKSSTTFSTCNTNGIRLSVYKYVQSSLHYFHKSEQHKDWYITPLTSILDSKVDRHLILEIGNQKTYVNNHTNNESKSNDDKSSMNNRISIKSVPAFYVGHTSGTKNKWVKDMVKEFLCHKSANKFDIKDSGAYIDKFVNSKNAQYLMLYHIHITDAPKSSTSDDSHSSRNEDFRYHEFLNKYNVEPIFVAVFSVNDFGGLLDLMATSPAYRRYGIATHMIYVIQAIVHAMKKNTTVTLHCDDRVQDSYRNMGFHIDDNCNKDILQYFELDSNFKNDAKHKVFKITSLIETKLVIYEMRKCCQFTDEELIINANTYVNAILKYMEK